MYEQSDRPATPEPERPNWGEPVGQQPRKSGTWKKTAGAVAVAAVVVTGGTLAVNAANASGSTGTATGLPGVYGTGPLGGYGPGQGGTAPAGPEAEGGTDQGPGPHGPGGPGGPHGARELRDVLHGDFVVTNPDGGYLTRRMQTGAVTALAGGKLTIKSTDGYSSSYTVGEVPTTGIAVGDTVTAVGTVSGSTITLLSLHEKGTRPAGQDGAPGERPDPPAPGQAPGEQDQAPGTGTPAPGTGTQAPASPSPPSAAPSAPTTSSSG